MRVQGAADFARQPGTTISRPDQCSPASVRNVFLEEARNIAFAGMPILFEGRPDIAPRESCAAFSFNPLHQSPAGAHGPLLRNDQSDLIGGTTGPGGLLITVSFS